MAAKNLITNFGDITFAFNKVLVPILFLAVPSNQPSTPIKDVQFHKMFNLFRPK